MLHVDPVILTIRAPWAAGRSKPLSMAHCLKTWRISSPGAPGMVCWTPKKNVGLRSTKLICEQLFPTYFGTTIYPPSNLLCFQWMKGYMLGCRLVDPSLFEMVHFGCPEIGNLLRWPILHHDQTLFWRGCLCRKTPGSVAVEWRGWEGNWESCVFRMRFSSAKSQLHRSYTSHTGMKVK